MSFEIVAPEAVRACLHQEGVDADDLRYGNPQLTSNIRAASTFLQRQTRRQLEPQSAATKTFTSHGRAVVPVYDLRSVTSITLQGAALEAGQTYWLIPDPVTPEVYTAVQIRAYSGGNYRSNPQWFERNLDRDARRGLWPASSLPNDLVIVGDWGHSPYEDDLQMAAAVLAAWYTKRPDAVLANVAVTAAGSELRYDAMPPEVMSFIHTWRREEEIAVVN